MAFPFVQWPTLGEFLLVAQGQFGAQIRTVKAPPQQQYIFRNVGADQYIAAMPRLNMSDRLDPDLLRSLCRQLNIPLDAFGISMTWQ